MAGWTDPLNLIKEELVQRRDEGCRIPEDLGRRIEALGEGDAWNYERIDPLYDELMQLEEDGGRAAREPNDLEAIRALRPEGPRDLGWRPDADTLFDRLHGAITGRCMGCALGKPVEGMAISRGRKPVEQYLRNRGDWPLRDFFSNRDVGDGMTLGCPASTREHIAYMEPDDDIHYTLTGLGVLEQAGPDFTWRDVGRYWAQHIPITAICTAERQAFMNLLNRSKAGSGGPATPEFTRRHRNPYREWIGAQIRADGLAFACAGKPELAAEFAWRDAHWTHERNGIYGEMFIAAAEAAAFVEADPRRLIEIGLSEIPAECRLALHVRQVLAWVESCPTWDQCMAKVEATLPQMNGVHTINNALICVLSLFYGRMDSIDVTTIAVMCGLDTDCNGATVGAIVGAATGRRAMRDDLARRLNDRIRVHMLGFTDTTMSEVAERFGAVWQRTDEYARTRTADAARQ